MIANSSGYKGISRIDSPKKNTYGWYVRVTFRCQTHSKFFSDSVHGGAEKALARAVRYRNQMEREIGKPRTDRTVATTNPRNRTGVLGVKRVEKGPGGAYEVTWSPEPNVIRRTTVSVRKYGEQEAFRRACAIRQRYEREMYGGAVKGDEDGDGATEGRKRGRPSAAADAAPARRGRKPAVAAAAEPKRRGRPPGSANKAAAATAEAPKRRGRPPGSGNKAAAATSAGPKRRGRPPGSGSQAAASAEAPKRRGRPPGSGSTAAAATSAAPKRRGRPPGSANKASAAAPAAGRRRGRPPGSANRATATAGTGRRGRPRGS